MVSWILPAQASLLSNPGWESLLCASIFWEKKYDESHYWILSAPPNSDVSLLPFHEPKGSLMTIPHHKVWKNKILPLALMCHKV